jgi:hypothetical protein
VLAAAAIITDAACVESNEEVNAHGLSDGNSGTMHTRTVDDLVKLVKVNLCHVAHAVKAHCGCSRLDVNYYID